MKKVAVVVGGTSSEREISLLSGQGVFNALKAKGYPVVLIDLKEDLVAFIRELKSQNPDVIFNALHGRFGEDGNIQGVFNLMRIPYTHSGCLASALAMDKKMTKRLLKDAGIPMAADKMVTLEDIRKGDTLPFPYVIKPNNEGSSVGVSIIESQTDEDYLINSWPFGEAPVLMEEYIKGREMSVPVPMLNSKSTARIKALRFTRHGRIRFSERPIVCWHRSMLWSKKSQRRNKRLKSMLMWTRQPKNPHKTG